jgi:hypothetical protein
MGLLDEAIRDHLELKRQQGADPDELARKEREALEPVAPDEPATWGADASSPVVHDAREEPGVEMTGSAFEDEEPAPDIQGGVDAFSTVGQETAEIDMREVLGEDPIGPDNAYPVHRIAAAPVRAGRITDSAPQEELEWEVAGRAAGEPAHDISGQERLSFE